MTKLLPTIAVRPGRWGLTLAALVLSVALLGIQQQNRSHVMFAAPVAAPSDGWIRVGYLSVPYGGAWQDFPQLYDGTYTHLIAAFYLPDTTGNLAPVDAAQNFTPSLRQRAQAGGSKVLFSVGGGTVHYSVYVAIANDAVARQNFVNNVLSVLQSDGYDGVDFNFEGWDDTMTIAQRDQVLGLLSEAAGAVKDASPAYVTSTALAALYYINMSADCNLINSAQLDYAYHMGYDFYTSIRTPNGPWRRPGTVQYLYPPGSGSTENSVYGALSYLRDQGCNMGKIAGGIPYYTTNLKTWNGVRTATDWASTPLHADYLEKQHVAQGYWVNDPEAVAAKVSVYRDFGLGGVMVWQVGHEGPMRELSNALLAASPAVPPTCTNPTAALTSDYTYAVGSAGFSDPDGDPENGSTFRWLASGSPVASGPVAEGLLLHFDGTTTGANGEAPLSASGVGYANGRFGQALALANPGVLTYPRADNLALDEGTWELWVAPRAAGDNPVYADPDRWHVLLYYEAANGDNLFIALDRDTGVLYAGGSVNGQWQSAYSSAATTRTWQAGQWHHVAFTYSAAGNFMRFYLDGRPVADTNEDHYRPPAATGAHLAVGGTPWNGAAHFWLDGVRISGRAADAAEIAARARRAEPAGPNEVWLPTAGLTPGTTLVYEFTPQAGGQSGAACSSPALLYPGIPVTNPQPPSTLLPPGSTSLALSVETADATACRWAVGAPRPFDQMTPFDSDATFTQHAARSTQGATRLTQSHTTIVTGLDPDPNTVNAVPVRCASHPDYLLTLYYRSLSAANPRFPRTGNLWGWWDFIQKGLPYMARVDLWLGADGLSGDQIAALRGLNPDIRVLTSINAVENNDLSRPECNGCTGAACDAWYLKDVNGNPIEVWPGSYRINLTKPAVAEYQACYAYQSWVASGYQADGVFFDNVMTTQSWLTEDIYGNPVQIDADEDGVADDPAALDAAWKAGVFHEIETFRALMPHAIASGHSTDIHEPGIAGLFNGISIGFRTANVLEGEESFPEVFDDYRDWLRLAKSPPTTMIESSPLDDIAYGYDYDPLSKIPASTLEFARTYTPWMRFGLAFTLMDDGYFAHEFGDTHHGNDWWYDELDFDLGYPLGPAGRVPAAGFDPGPNQIVNPGFEQPIAWPWDFWADTGSGCAATLARDTAASAPEGNAAARVDVTATCGEDWQIELAQYNRSLTQGTVYDVTFWARSTVTRTLTVSSQQGSAPWTWYGLWRTVEVGPAWREYTVSFEAIATVNDARIQFLFGDATGTVWVDDVRLTRHPPDVFRRDFDHGIVLLNGTRQAQTIELGPGFRRLVGDQAPRHEAILDDADPGFSVISGAWQQTGHDSGEWMASGPFYHDWGVGLRQLNSSAGAVRWDLPISAADTYTVSAWWPAAPEATGWNAAAQYEVVANGVVVASAVLDQRTGGDRWHDIATVSLAPGDAPFVRLTCSAAPCVADALHLLSAGRYNDGSPAASVSLAPLDGIVLARVPAVPPDIYLPLIVANAAELHWTTDPANCRYDVHCSAAPYFTPSDGTAIAVGLPAGSNSYTDVAAHIGDPAVADYYLVRAFGCDGVTTADSGRVGYVDFALVPGQ